MTNHEKHILLWDELARTGSKDKYEVFDKLFPDQNTDSLAYSLGCWACQECQGKCSKCPIDWGVEDCTCSNSLFTQWNLQPSKSKRKLLAAQIRDLPWREK